MYTVQNLIIHKVYGTCAMYGTYTAKILEYRR